jgi:hypothetical protein
MTKKKRTMDELRQVKTYGYKEPLPKHKIQGMIYERNPDNGEIKSRPIRTIDSTVEGWSDKIERMLTKIDNMSNKIDKIIEAIDNMK